MMFFNWFLISTSVVLCFVLVKGSQQEEVICTPPCPPSTICVRRKTICFFHNCPILQQCIRTTNRNYMENKYVKNAVAEVLAPTHPPERVCPQVPQNGPCIEQCRYDNDCELGSTCCFNGCGHICRPTNRRLRKKGGTCPWYLPQMKSICGVQCLGDYDCRGLEKCCETSCGSKCSPPCFHWLKPSSGTWHVSRRCRSGF